jgi:uncharacterized membrane protein
MNVDALALTDRFGARRAIALLVALGMLVSAAQAWGNTIASPSTGILSLLLTGSLLVIAVLIACAADEEQVAKLEPLLLGAGLVALLVLSASSLPSPPRYGTDSAGFLHAAALALKAGHDPYATNLSWSIKAFGFQPTYTTNGGHWTFFGYPSLSLLATVALVSLRSGIAAATIVNVAALALAMTLLYRALPERLRALAPLICVVLPGLPNQSIGGVSEVILLPTLIVVAHRWRDVGRGGVLGREGVLRAVALGLAVSTNQLAWFLVPFLLTGMVLMRRPELGVRGSVRITARYVGVAAAVFTVLNAGFFLWNPGAWINTIFAGFSRPVVPSGQGLPVNLMIFAHLGGGNLAAFSATLVLCYLALLVLYTLKFDRLHWCCFILPSVALWFGDISMISYLTVPVVPLLVSLVNGGERPHQMRFSARILRPGVLRAAPVVAFAPALLALAIALGSPAPLAMKFATAAERFSTRHVREMTISVSNHSGKSLTPHFQTSSDISGGFWHVLRGPRTLASGTTARYVLTPPDPKADPTTGSSFSLEAVTAQPTTFSSARLTVTAPK